MNVIPIRPEQKQKHSFVSLAARKAALERAIAESEKMLAVCTERERLLDKRRARARILISGIEGKIVENAVHLNATRVFLSDLRDQYGDVLREMHEEHGA